MTHLVLARFEGRRLLCHPAFLVGLAFTAYVMVASKGPDQVADAYTNLTGFALMPLGLGTLLASHLGALRARTARTEELLEAASAPPTVRTAGHLLAVLAPLTVAVGLSVAGVALGTARDVFSLRFPGPADFLQGPLAVAAAGMLGMVLARWLPSRALLIPLSIALMAWNLILVGTAATWFKPTVDVVVYAGDGSYGWEPAHIGGFVDGSVALHCLALAGVAGILSSSALLRHGRTAKLLTLLAVSVVAAAAGAVLQGP